jgi:hypothetical protein
VKGVEHAVGVTERWAHVAAPLKETLAAPRGPLHANQPNRSGQSPAGGLAVLPLMLGSQRALNDNAGVMDRINRIFQDEQDDYESKQAFIL